MKQLEDTPYPLIKWLTDKSIAIFLLLIVSPLLISIFVAMYLNMLFRSSDRGGIFYRETRITRGRKFDILKFRVLKEDVLTLMVEEGKHARVYEEDVDNLTWTGKYILKKCYLDELPQLFNILKGDMSLVGPRPWPVYMVDEQIEKGIEYRNHIVAGWTGVVQLEKGSKDQKNFDQLVQLDLDYFDDGLTKSSFFLWRKDMGILIQTIKVMLKRGGLEN